LSKVSRSWTRDVQLCLSSPDNLARNCALSTEPEGAVARERAKFVANTTVADNPTIRKALPGPTRMDAINAFTAVMLLKPFKVSTAPTPDSAAKIQRPTKFLKQ
jgi:hypothetical protein